jgi:DNA-binding NarL/FixJ family response regulator
MIRLAVVDDHPAISAAIAAAVEGRFDIELVGRASGARDAVELIDRTSPDVVVCDIWLDGEAAGLEILRQRAGADRPRFLVLSAFDQPSFLRAAIEAGAAGYLSKATDVGEIVDAVIAVDAGEAQWDDARLRAVARAPRPPSNREVQAIRLIAEGASNDEIAAALGISVKTVESHLRRLFGRYAVLSRTELAMLAVREGWLTAVP